MSLKTGEMTDIHPHFQEANELALKESQKCHIILKERIEHLEKYWFTLKESLTRHQNVISRRIIELCEGDSAFFRFTTHFLIHTFLGITRPICFHCIFRAFTDIGLFCFW